ncbi:hypothetical protein BHE74_00013335 [Ensete ventricosum]|nr:hypothetical protein BHE74_00013335 [Ensete ventricosum]
MDTKALRELEVMKLCHDFDSIVTEESLAVIRERYSIPNEYALHAPLPGQRPYSSSSLGLCISIDALEAGLCFPLHLTIEECLVWWRISLSQVAPNSWHYLIAFLGECQGVGITPTRNLFMACFHIYKSWGGYYLTARVGFKVNGAPSNNKGWKTRDLFVSGPRWGFRLDWSGHSINNVPPFLSEEESILVGRLKGILSSSRVVQEMTELWLVEAGLNPASSIEFVSAETSPRVASAPTPKRPSVGSMSQPDDPVRVHKRVKMLSGQHKSRCGEGRYRLHSKDKEPVASGIEPDQPVFHRRKSMKDLFEMLVRKDDKGYYALYMFDLVPRDPNDETQLEKEAEKLKAERDKAILRLEASDKDLNDVRGDLSVARRQLKEQRAKACKADNNLLKATMELEAQRVELPKHVIEDYKGTIRFKLGLPRMGWVSYGYGYRVALARFRALHPDSKVEEDPSLCSPKMIRC